MQLAESIYTFSVLQYRHDAWIGEALNVGVLLSSPEHRFIRLKARTASPRLTQAYPELGASGFRHLVRALEAKVVSIEQSVAQSSFFDAPLTSDEVAHKLLPDDDSALRWREPGAGVTSEPDSELERLFARYVSRWDPKHARDQRSDDDVFTVFHKKLRRARVDVTLEEKVVKTPRFGAVKFRHAYQNGRLHVVQPISFDMANSDTLFGKAAKMHGTLMRLQDNPNVLPYIVTGAPRNRQLANDYDGAVELLRGAGKAVEVVDEKDSDIVAEALAKAATSAG